MGEFEKISTNELLVRDIDMARFFIKYSIDNVEYILNKNEENMVLKEFYERAMELEKELEYYFDLLKIELDVERDKIEIKRAKAKKRRKQIK